MPIIKKSEVMPERPVIIVLYGTPGTGKTSLANTANNPILIDTDRGSDRASNRVDTLMASKWLDIENEKEAIKAYDTVVVDTAKALLDDYLSDYVVTQNYKLKSNGLKRFGEMAEKFKEFVNFLRQNQSDIIFVCHDKEQAEGDVIKHSPECTGQSKDLLLRIADQVGYVTMVNGQRTIVFDPTDTTIGKNVAQISPMRIPDVNSVEFPTCMAEIISKVKQSLVGKSEAQKEAQEQLDSAREKLKSAKTIDDANELISITKTLPKPMQSAFSKKVVEEMKKLGFIIKDGKFISNE
jgi:ATP-dependent Lon protease